MCPSPSVVRHESRSVRTRHPTGLDEVFADATARLIASAAPLHLALPEQPRVPPRVLLVDDCPVQQLLGCVLLARWQIVPELANDGLEAVLLAREKTFDLLLMDVEMPVLDGLAATRRIRQHEQQYPPAKRLPIVAYTANHALDERTWRECGMDALLHKVSPEPVMQQCLQRWCPDSFSAASPGAA